MDCLKRTLCLVGGGGWGAFFGAGSSAFSVDVPMKVGAMVGASLGFTKAVILVECLDRLSSDHPIKKACITTVGVVGAFFTGTALGVNLCRIAEYPISFTTGLEVSGGAVASCSCMVGTLIVFALLFNRCCGKRGVREERIAEMQAIEAEESYAQLPR